VNVPDSHNNQNNAQGGQGGGGRNRRRHRPHRGDSNRSGAPAPRQGQASGPPRSGGENRQRDHQGGGSRRRSSGRPLTTNQVLVKYDNLLEQHLIMRKKYYEYFNRVDDRQLRRLEKNFFDSIEHLRRFEANLEPWQREALEARKTERYRPDFTYSSNHDLDPFHAPVEVAPEEIEDPHFKESQKEAFAEYQDDTEESVGTLDDYLKHKGLA
jgi:hypothetical protein